MKRLLSLLILIFMVVSLVTLINRDNNNAEPVLLSDITYEIDIQEMKEVIEPTPIPKPTPDPVEVATQKMQKELSEIEYIEDKMEWFLAYKDIVYKYTKWIRPPETVFDAFSEEEVTLICRTVETETYDQDFESKCNVASVIFNRLKVGGEFGDSITEIITRKNQFAYWRKILTEDTILAVMFAFEIGDTTDGCVGFRSDIAPKKWYGWNYVRTDNAGHHLYR